MSRSASRHIQGFGLHLDNVSSIKTHSPTDSGHAAAHSQWERLYVRVHRFPTAAAAIWRCAGATSGNAGIEVGILPSGQLTITSIDSGGTRTLLVTVATALAVHVWKKIDILFKYSDNATPNGFFHLFINGARAVVLPSAAFAAAGLNQQQVIGSSTIGDAAGAGKGLTIDYDDWVGADLPNPSAATVFLEGDLAAPARP